MAKLIMKVRENKGIGTKLITIPQDSDIQVGDYVEVIKL